MIDRSERVPERWRAWRAAWLVVFAVTLAGCAGQSRDVSTVPGSSRPEAPGTASSTDTARLAEKADQAAAERERTDADPSGAAEELDRGRKALEPLEANPADETPAENHVQAEEVDPVSEEPLEPSPLDELGENTPQTSQSDLARERELVRSAAAAGPTFDIPMVVNDQVLAYVDNFTGPRRDWMLASLARSGRYLDMIQSTFEHEGIPRDLAYMAHVESAFKVTAYSRAKAKGIFQFISGTGRRYGLRIDSWVDERSDPEKATRAAAAYLRDLYGMFGDWYLALAAYNTGEGNVQRLMARTGKNDFWELASGRRALHRETRGYVPAILAATLIAKDAASYGLEYQPETPLRYDIVTVPGGAPIQAIAKIAGADYETLKLLNADLRRQRTPPGSEWLLRVPEGTGPATLAALEGASPRDLSVAASHSVARGETLSSIAKRYGVTTSALRQANGLGRKAGISVGQTLAVPYADGGSADPDVARASHRIPAGQTIVYRVQRGDTLAGIARRHRTTPAAIAKASGISVSSTLQVGQKLRIAGPSSAVASKAVSGSNTPNRAAVDKIVHTVRPGESLTRIASKYRVTVDEICELNHISRGDTLYPGRRLTIREN